MIEKRDDFYLVAEMAVKSSIVRAGIYLCPDDIEDMLQEACISNLEIAEKSEAYRFVSARHAAHNWLIWWKYGASADKLRRGLLQRIEEPIDLDCIEDCAVTGVESECLFEDDDSRKANKIREILSAFRKERQEIATIETDVTILMCLLNGDSVRNICDRFGFCNVSYVNRHRRKIRKELEMFLELRKQK